MPAACGISQTVDGAIGWPRRASSPCMRRWPHVLFSLASRRMICLMVGAVDGLAGRRCWGNVYFRAVSCRCQASSVVGVTANTRRQRSRGTSRERTASQVRSTGMSGCVEDATKAVVASYRDDEPVLPFDRRSDRGQVLRAEVRRGSVCTRAVRHSPKA